jgi:hypothetical protein
LVILAISPIDPGFGEQTAQPCANALVTQVELRADVQWRDMFTLPKDRQPELYEQLVRIFYRHDPIGLAYLGAPSDEYAPEVGTILPRLAGANSAEDVTRIIYEEFGRWFGAESTTGPKTKYSAIGDEIWSLLTTKFS